MAASFATTLRPVLWIIHRWIGVGLCLLLVPIALSGALLVFKDQLDALMHPARYAVTGPEVKLSVSDYIASAASSLGSTAQPSAVQFPDSAGWPVKVLARRASASTGGPARLLTVYLDPPTGRVLDVMDFRASFFGIVHRFHENLTIPEYSGRSIAGWAGVGMFFLAMTGICLWWPRNGVFFAGLRWRRANAEINNLHHLLGFWISVPLAIVSATGVYLAFPQSARSLMGSIASVSPPQRATFSGPIVSNPQLTPDRALDVARGKMPDAHPIAVFLPTRIAANAGQGGRGRSGAGANGEQGAPPTPIWRVQLRSVQDGLVTLLVNDQNGEARQAPAPLAGDRAAQWIRWLHQGERGRPIWPFVVLFTGIFPAIFATTGVIMWLRGRRQGQRLRKGQAGSLQAAE